jgi:hypothetical protein
MLEWQEEIYGAGYGIRRTHFELVRVNDVATSAVTLSFSSGQFVPYNTTGGAFTITLPASPTEGMQFNFSENAGSATALTIDGNGKNINGASTLSMAVAYRQRKIRYSSATGVGQWIVIGGI